MAQKRSAWPPRVVRSASKLTLPEARTRRLMEWIWPTSSRSRGSAMSLRTGGLRDRGPERRGHRTARGASQVGGAGARGRRGDRYRPWRCVAPATGGQQPAHQRDQVHAHGGRVAVRLERERDRAQLTVVDTGMGIRPEVLPQLFNRFVQADSSVTRTHGGLGLGLSIIRHLVEAHGGSVHAESPGGGKGSTFRVKLPVGARAEERRVGKE